MRLINSKTTINKLLYLRISVGVVYVWFGLLKFFPQLSPAENLAVNTIDMLTFGMLSPTISINILAIWEVAVGVFLIFNLMIRQTIIAALIHMICTFTPLIIFPGISFSEPPFAFTLVGQYIMKNIIIVGVLLLLLPEKKDAKIKS